MQILFLVALTSVILEISTVSAVWMTTMLPLPSDLELLIDSMYDDGYSPEYLVKYDDISGEDIAQSDLMLGWERNLGEKAADKPVFGIIDPDRDGTRNLPPWMNFSKAVFVPNEIDYKIRARHRLHPHSGRMAGALQKHVEDHYHPGVNNDVNFGPANQESRLPTKASKPSTPENLDFLIPIPEYGTTNKQCIKQDKKMSTTKKAETKPNVAVKSLLNSNIIQQNLEIPLMTPGPEIIATQLKSSNNNGPSLFGFVNVFRKKFKPEKKVNFKSEDFNRNSYTLDDLYKKLLQMKERNEVESRQSEEDKEIAQLNESSDNNIHMKKLKAMRPLVTHTRMMRPGHRTSYVAHIGPLTSHHRNKYSRRFKREI